MSTPPAPGRRTRDESVAVRLGRQRAPMAAVVRQPGLEAFDGIAEQHEHPSSWGCGRQQRWDPAQVHVIRGPLPGDHPCRAWEPPVVLRALLGAKRACGEAIEEVPLLVDVVALRHAGVRGDQRKPPSGSGLLGADAYEVGRTRDLTRTRLGGVKSKPSSHGAKRPRACRTARRTGAGSVKKVERARSFKLIPKSSASAQGWSLQPRPTSSQPPRASVNAAQHLGDILMKRR